jgi:hypothetical protein
MLVRKLYIVNNFANDIDMLFASCLLDSTSYKVVVSRCGDREFGNVNVAYHRACIDEIEVDVNGKQLDDVIRDLYEIDQAGRVWIGDMIFIAETEYGEYIQLELPEIVDVEEGEEEDDDSSWEYPGDD